MVCRRGGTESLGCSLLLQWSNRLSSKTQSHPAVVSKSQLSTVLYLGGTVQALSLWEVKSGSPPTASVLLLKFSNLGDGLADNNLWGFLY